MGWVKLPEFFCAASKIVADKTNGYALETTSIFVMYPSTDGAHKTTNGATDSPDYLQYVGVYMDNLFYAKEGDPTQQQKVSELTTTPSRISFLPC